MPDRPRRSASPLQGSVRGVSFVIGLGLAVLLGGLAISTVLVWLLT